MSYDLRNLLSPIDDKKKGATVKEKRECIERIFNNTIGQYDGKGCIYLMTDRCPFKGDKDITCSICIADRIIAGIL